MREPDDDRDLPQDIDLEDSEDDNGLIECPSCGLVVEELADRCEHCGDWIIQPSEAQRRSQGWAWPAAVAILVAVILVYWLRL